MDLAGRAGCISDLSAELALECPAPLAVSGINAKYPGGRARRGPRPLGLLRPADVSGQPANRAHLAGGIVRSVAGAALPAVPLSGLVLCGLLHRLLCSPWKELLLGADLSHAA